MTDTDYNTLPWRTMSRNSKTPNAPVSISLGATNGKSNTERTLLIVSLSAAVFAALDLSSDDQLEVSETNTDTGQILLRLRKERTKSPQSFVLTKRGVRYNTRISLRSLLAGRNPPKIQQQEIQPVLLVAATQNTPYSGCLVLDLTPIITAPQITLPTTANAIAARKDVTAQNSVAEDDDTPNDNREFDAENKYQKVFTIKPQLTEGSILRTTKGVTESLAQSAITLLWDCLEAQDTSKGGITLKEVHKLHFPRTSKRRKIEETIEWINAELNDKLDPAGVELLMDENKHYYLALTTED